MAEPEGIESPGAPMDNDHCCVQDQISEYAGEVARLLEAGLTGAELVGKIAPLKQRLLETPDLIPDVCHQGLDENPYTRSLLYADPAGRFTVMACVWAPSRQSLPHDHTAWGVVGAYRDGIEVVDYDVADQETRTLVERSPGRRPLHRGDVMRILPPREHNIHVMANSGPTASISIHTYGDSARECRTYNLRTGQTTDRNLVFHHEIG